MAMQWYIIIPTRALRRKSRKPGEPRGRVQFAGQDRTRVDSDGRHRGSARREESGFVAHVLSGYVLVEMDLDENTWHIVRSTPRHRICRLGDIASPLSEAEVDAIINRVHVPTDRPKPKSRFRAPETSSPKPSSGMIPVNFLDRPLKFANARSRCAPARALENDFWLRPVRRHMHAIDDRVHFRFG